MRSTTANKTGRVLHLNHSKCDFSFVGQETTRYFTNTCDFCCHRGLRATTTTIVTAWSKCKHNNITIYSGVDWEMTYARHAATSKTYYPILCACVVCALVQARNRKTNSNVYDKIQYIKSIEGKKGFVTCLPAMCVCIRPCIVWCVLCCAAATATCQIRAYAARVDASAHPRQDGRRRIETTKQNAKRIATGLC